MEYIIKVNGNIENQTYEINASKTYNVEQSKDWFYSIDTQNPNDFYQPNVECLHKKCSRCNGTGTRLDGLGACIHSISCPCPKCNPARC